MTTLFASISTLRVAQPVCSHIVSVRRRRFPASLTGPFPEAREALMSGVRQGDDERQTGRAHALPPRREALPVSVVPAHLHHHLQPANSPTHSHRFVRSLSFVSLVERSSVCLVLLLLGATIDGGWGGGCAAGCQCRRCVTSELSTSLEAVFFLKKARQKRWLREESSTFACTKKQSR